MTYSIVIRTLGTGGEKYQALLDSIACQKVQPQHVYVVIAEGYKIPQEQIGTEEFLFTKKGMLHQRVYGLEYANVHCHSDFILCLDDDIAFDSDYAAKALGIMNNTDCDMLMPAVLNVGQTTVETTKVWSRANFYALFGVRVESRRSPFRTSIIPTAGFKANTSLRGEVPTQSSTGAGFWIKKDIIPSLDMHDEYWVEQCRYALPEDQVLGYKAYLKGVKMIYSTNVSHTHLDSCTSNQGKERAYHFAYAQGRNFLIFWHRFIYTPEHSALKNIVNVLAISYRLTAVGMLSLVKTIKKKSISDIKGYLDGLKSAIKYLRSQEYASLPRISKNHHVS